MILTGTNISVDNNRQVLHIKLKEFINHATFILVSLDGKIIKQSTLTNQETTVIVGPVPSGVYIAQIIYNDEFETKKVIF